MTGKITIEQKWHQQSEAAQSAAEKLPRVDDEAKVPFRPSSPGTCAWGELYRQIGRRAVSILAGINAGIEAASWRRSGAVGGAATPL
jgi:hypothetical protein